MADEIADGELSVRDTDVVVAGDETGERVVAVRIGDGRCSRGERSVLEQLHGDVRDADVDACVEVAVVVGVGEHTVAEREPGGVTEVDVAAVGAVRQGHSGRACCCGAVEIERCRQIGVDGGDGDGVLAAGDVVDQPVAVCGGGRREGHVVTAACDTVPSEPDGGDEGVVETGLSEVLHTVAVGVEPHPITDRAGADQGEVDGVVREVVTDQRDEATGVVAERLVAGR